MHRFILSICRRGLGRCSVSHVNYQVYSAGQGPVVLLIHGYGETAEMWFPLMEKWKSKYRMFAPDLRGFGETDIADTGYDKKTVATDLKTILDKNDITSAIVIGHDIGLMVAYAFAALYPQMTEKLVLMDAFLPGIGPGQEIYDSPDIWHFRFHGPYAEKLVEGKERIFLDSIWDGFAAHPERFTEVQRAHYTHLYARPGRMRAGWEYFKVMPQDAIDNQILVKTKLKMPVLSLGGEKSLGEVMAATVLEITDHPTSKIIPDCGHWMLEECPDQTIEALEEFLSRDASLAQSA